MRVRSIVRAVSILLAVMGTVESRGVERAKVAGTPSGILPSQTQARILLRGFSGELRVRLGASGEVRYHCIRAAPPRADLPIDVWRTGTAIEMTPPDGAAPEARILEVNVPSDMSVVIEGNDTKVVTQGLRSGIEVHGARLDLDARATEGPIAIDIREGQSRVESATGDLSLRGERVKAILVKIAGRVDLDLTDSTVEGQSLGSIETSLERTTLKVTEIAGPLRVRAHGGAVEIRRMQKGGELLLSATPVLLQESRGDVDVQTDAEVRFVNTDIDLHVDSYGGSVRGNGNTGLLEVKTASAEVAVAEVSGPTRVSGQALKVDLQHVSGEIFVEVASSDVSIADASSGILVISENGNVTVNRAMTEVEVKSTGGDVHALDVHGPLTIEADGDLVEVSLVAPCAITDSVVRNDGGAVELRVPPALGIRLLAETRFGHIENSLPLSAGTGEVSAADLEIGPQGGDHATVRVFAARDIVLAPR